eukprot:scaffold25969_cov63-Phaeocystis_antarctica.AAC.1
MEPTRRTKAAYVFQRGFKVYTETGRVSRKMASARGLSSWTLWRVRRACAWRGDRAAQWSRPPPRCT